MNIQVHQVQQILESELENTCVILQHSFLLLLLKQTVYNECTNIPLPALVTRQSIAHRGHQSASYAGTTQHQTEGIVLYGC